MHLYGCLHVCTLHGPACSVGHTNAASSSSACTLFVPAGLGDLTFDIAGYAFALLSCAAQGGYLLLVEFQVTGSETLQNGTCNTVDRQAGKGREELKRRVETAEQNCMLHTTHCTVRAMAMYDVYGECIMAKRYACFASCQQCQHLRCDMQPPCGECPSLPSPSRQLKQLTA